MSLYTLLVFKENLPAFAIAVIAMQCIGMTGTCSQMLAMGSKSIIISRKILHQIKRSTNCKWSRRFFKSCPEISLSVGEFHKMDRERAPAFIRFILQRTFFLVLRTKFSLGSGSRVNIDI